ncbi:hypothetical protein A2U01_0036400, partial [Trifolium medium]|nr:hypothetical protein [Trifolium medium]
EDDDLMRELERRLGPSLGEWFGVRELGELDRVRSGTASISEWFGLLDSGLDPKENELKSEGIAFVK